MRNKYPKDFIHEINLSFDKDKLIKESEIIGYENGYILRGQTRPAFKTLLESRIEDISEIEKYDEINKVYNQIVNLFKCDIHSIIFYKVRPNTYIGPHKDPFTKINIGFAIIILLSEDKNAPLKFIIEDKHYDVFYKCILFDANNVEHYVPKVEKERIVLRYFIKDISYSEAIKICEA